MIDPSIFHSLQSKIDQESEIRDSLHEITNSLARKNRITQATLSRAHFTPSHALPALLDAATEQLADQRADLHRLRDIAAPHPFYLYNHTWTRDVQDLVFATLLCAWLGGLKEYRDENGEGFMSVDEVGRYLAVDVNVKDTDTFHLTIEEYLFALISLVDELSRLAVNSVTQGDFARPLAISKFIGEIHAGFQLLNLKNGALRQRSDGVKYAVKRVEGVVYDLSLRGLIKREE